MSKKKRKKQSTRQKTSSKTINKKKSKKVFKNKFLQKLLLWFERLTDRLIPFLIIGLLILLIVDNPFWTLFNLEEYHTYILVFDYFVIFFFVVDLIFKWFRVRRIGKFFKLYWLDIVAVFPFYLAFRLAGEVATFLQIGEEVAEVGQKLAHESVLLREESEIIKEIRATRASKGGRIVRVFQRILRALKGRFYFTHKSMKHVSKKHRQKKTSKITEEKRNKNNKSKKATKNNKTNTKTTKTQK